MPQTPRPFAVQDPVLQRRFGGSETQLWWLLRVAVAMCYIGHGAFGIITKAEWLPFFALVGIGPELAFRLMPVIGAVDILLGISALVSPRRFVLLHMVVWSVWTAALRPLTGQSLFEMLERAGNYGVPLAMLVMAGTRRTWRDWFAEVRPGTTSERRRLMRGILVVTTALLLLGHGGLAAIEQKPLLAQHAGSIGLTATAATAAGWLEIALALVVLRWQPVALLAFIALWKVGTELLFPVSGAPWWEFIERGGSYAAPLALIILVTAARREVEDDAVPLRRDEAGIGARSPARSALGMLLLCLTTLLILPGSVLAQGGAKETARELPASGRAAEVGDAELSARLVRGGNVLVCRHTATDHSAADSGPTRDRQRNLTREGEQQARRIGAAVRDLGLRIGSIRSNPMYRNVETAELAFGRARIDATLAGQPAADSIRAALRRRPAAGTNDVIVTRIGILLRVFPRSQVGTIEEGDCIVVAAGENGSYQVLRRLSVRDWERLAAMHRTGAGHTRSR